MGWFEDLQKVLGYPASVLTGLAKSGSEHEVVDRRTGEVVRKYDPLKEGFKGELSPSRWRAMTNPETDKRTGGQQVADTALDVLYDPMTWAGGLGLAGKGLKGLGVLDDAAKATGKLGQIYEGTNLLGKVEGATNLNRGGQMARRAYQAMQLGGDGTAAMMAYPLVSGTERAGAKLLTKALAKGGARTAEQLAADSPEALANAALKGVTPEDGGQTPLKALEAAMERKRLELGPGPSVRRATETTDLFPDGRPMPAAEPKALGSGPASGIGENIHPVGPRDPEILALNGSRGALSPGQTPARPMPGIPGESNYDDVLAKLLGGKQDAALEAGQYPSTVLNDLLSSGRSGKGHFLNPEGRNVIETFLANPSARDQVLRSRTTKGIPPEILSLGEEALTGLLQSKTLSKPQQQMIKELLQGRRNG